MMNTTTSFRFEVNTQGKLHAAGSTNSVNPDFGPNLDTQYPDSFSSDALSIALIGPDEERRKAAAIALA